MKRKKLFLTIGGLIVVIGIGGVIASRGKSDASSLSLATATRAELIQSVEETGQVIAEFEGTYGFELSGSVATISRSVGDMVLPGDVIAELDSTGELQSLRQAQASLASDRALLNRELAGVSDERKAESLASVSQAEASLAQASASLAQAISEGDSSIATAQSALETAEINLRVAQETGTSKITQDAYADALNTMNTAFAALRDALSEADNILGIDNTLANDSIEDALGVTSQESLRRAEQLYPMVKQAISIVEDNLFTISGANDQSAIDITLLLTTDALSEMRQLLITVDSVLSTAPAIGVTQTQLDTFRTDIITELTAINTQLTNNTNATQAIESADTSLLTLQVALDKATQDLASARTSANASKQVAEANVSIQQAAVEKANASHESLIAPPRNVDVASLRAAVQRSSAVVLAAQKELEKTQLIAIATGTISNLEIEPGENVTANTAVVTILSDELHIDLDVSESDIAKVAIDDTTEITLDAFGDDVIFNGHVATIEPAETEVSGVIYYNTNVLFDQADQAQIRPGMTANVRIITDTRMNTIVIPQRAVIRETDRTYVRVLTDAERGTYEERDVTTGLRGDDGQIEILSGVAEGDQVVTFIKE